MAESRVAPYLLIVWLFGCSKLPEFAEPKAGEVTSNLEAGDSISYRTLERSDFRRKEPPGQIRYGEYELGAQTCAYLRTDPGVSIQIQSKTEPDGDVSYEGWLEKLRFYAFMDRDCSWWNPKSDDPDYTLQHEQIHFAISEIAARRLNREAQKAMKEWRETADSQEEVVERLKARVSELLNEYNQRALERNREFDEATSVGRNPKRQNEWWQEISRELRETEAWK